MIYKYYAPMQCPPPLAKKKKAEDDGLVTGTATALAAARPNCTALTTPGTIFQRQAGLRTVG